MSKTRARTNAWEGPNAKKKKKNLKNEIPWARTTRATILYPGDQWHVWPTGSQWLYERGPETKILQHTAANQVITAMHNQVGTAVSLLVAGLHRLFFNGFILKENNLAEPADLSTFLCPPKWASVGSAAYNKGKARVRECFDLVVDKYTIQYSSRRNSSLPPKMLMD
jgi:hypothetical protein